MAQAFGRPGQMLATHGMNPVFMMKGVEVVQHPLLDPDILTWTNDFLTHRLGKTPFIAKDVPGFIVNKGFIAWANFYLEMLVRGEGTVADIDTGLTLSLGHPQGIFMLIDRIGVDVMVFVSDALYKATQDIRYTIPQFLREMVKVDFLGAKSGQGFYDWTDPRNPVPRTIDVLMEL